MLIVTKIAECRENGIDRLRNGQLLRRACFVLIFFVYSFYLKAWETHDDSIIAEGYLLTSTCGQLGLSGARYRTAFSRDFPHFEVGKNLLKSF